jgi:hypothetical protein
VCELLPLPIALEIGEMCNVCTQQNHSWFKELSEGHVILTHGVGYDKQNSVFWLWNIENEIQKVITTYSQLTALRNEVIGLNFSGLLNQKSNFETTFSASRPM